MKRVLEFLNGAFFQVPMPRALFNAYLIIFLLTALVTLLGLVNALPIEPQFMDKLFWSLIIEVVGGLTALFGTWFLGKSQGSDDSSATEKRGLSPVAVAKNEDANSPNVVDLIRKTRPGTARMIEYSSMHAQTIIAALQEVHCHIQLLVRHPDVVSDIQKERIYARLTALSAIDFQTYQAGIEVRCYKAHASLRGRMLDNGLVNVGWYTPTYYRDTQGRPVEIYGHLNPVILADARTPEGKHLVDMFEKLWKELWKSSETETALAVLARRPRQA